MPIENRDLVVEGTRLAATYKGIARFATVQEGGAIKLDGDQDLGTTYKSLSAAGSAIMGGVACNGWRFWSLDGEAPAMNVAAESAESPAKAGRKAKATKAPKFKLITRMEEQPSDLEEGQVAWWCSACQRQFVGGAKTPEACAEGHRADDLEVTSAPVPGNH
jgi:hypothetical protein